MMETVYEALVPCPYCSFKITLGKDELAAGTGAVCQNCGLVSIVSLWEPRLRIPISSEREQLARDPRIQKLHQAWREQKLKGAS